MSAAAPDGNAQVAQVQAPDGTRAQQPLRRGDVRPYAWYIYSTYPSLAECRSQGDFLLSMGLIDDYYCAPQEYGWYTLHVHTTVVSPKGRVHR